MLFECSLPAIPPPSKELPFRAEVWRLFADRQEDERLKADFAAASSAHSEGESSAFVRVQDRLDKRRSLLKRAHTFLRYEDVRIADGKKLQASPERPAQEPHIDCGERLLSAYLKEQNLLQAESLRLAEELEKYYLLQMDGLYAHL